MVESTPQDLEKKKRRGPPKKRSQELAMSITQFCDRHGISEAFFYLLQQRGQAPRTMRLGARVLITAEEARRWREERTAAA
jgi:predicted DNA-binding transcriptional regulator AlpA